MTDLLKKLHSKSITINLIDDKLDIKAPKGAMTSELLSEIKEHKEALISFISEFKSEDSNKIVIPKAASNSSYVLSSSQYRLWLLQQIESNNNAYNMPGVFSLKGVIDIQNLEKAFLKLIERHEILRTNIIVEEETGIPKQIITSVEANNFKLKSIDISKDKEASKKLQSIINKDVNYNFDLASDALIRVSLIKKSNDDYALISVMHHIISDGWSSSIMISNLFSIYQSITKEEDTLLEPLSIQYKDFAEWQKSTLGRDSINEDKDYWLHQFKEEVQILDIPTYALRPSIKTYNGKTVEKRFEKEVIQGFKEICKDQGATLFMGLLSAVKILFYKYTNQTDIVIGSPFAGREHTELQNQIGFYVNTVGLRSSFEKEDTFKTLLNQVKNTVLEAYQHQNYPFDELIKNLDLKIDRSRNPLFDVMLTVDSEEETSDKLSLLQGLAIEEISLNDTTSKFDLEFAFKEDKEVSDLFLTYNTDIYTEDFVTQMTDHLEVILKNIIYSPESIIESIPYLTVKEKTTLLEGFNNNKTYYPKDKTIVDLFEEQVKKTPNNIAIVFREQKLTYTELNEQSNQLAHYLRETYTVQPDDLIGIKLERSEQLLGAIIGVLKSGAAYVPIDINYPEERINYIEKDSNCKVVIDLDELEKFRKVKDLYGIVNFQKITKPNHLAYVIYTSGTTGKPKGVMVEHRNTVAMLDWAMEEFNAERFDVVYAATSYCFDLSIFELFYPLSIGKKIKLLNNALEIGEVLQKDKKVFINAVPTSIRILIYNGVNLKNTTVINLAGEEFPIDIVKKLLATKAEVRNLYGPSEDTTYSTTYKLLPNVNYKASIPIGKPISNTSCYILDDNLEPLPIGISGKLYVSGAGVARGYLNKPELTKERFIANPFIEGERMYDTGDLAKWLPDGNIEFLGRKDNQVKIRGYRIELKEIQNTIIQFSDAIQQAVLYVKESENEKELVAYYVSKSEIEKSKLKAFLQQRLPSYMVPSYYVAIDKVPLTVNGKIDKKALPKITSESLIQKDYVAPRNTTEQELVEIWQEVLGVERIGINNDFFELGGTSLNLISLNNKIKSILKKKVDFYQLYNTPRFENQVDLLIGIGSTTKNKAHEVERLISKSLVLPFPAQERLYELSKGNSYYYIKTAIKCKIELNLNFIENVFNILIARHEVLRSNFIKIKGQVYLSITKEKKINLEYYNLKEFTNKLKIKKKNDILNKNIDVFDLEKDLLMRVKIIHLNQKEFMIFIVLDHLITDGWGLNIFFKELFDIYNSSDGRKFNTSLLAKKNNSYTSILQQKEILKQEKYEIDKKFWVNKFSDGGSPQRLPYDFDKTNIDFISDTFICQLKSTQAEKIIGFSKNNKVGILLTYLALVNLTLLKVLDQNDITTGIIFAEREDLLSSNEVGFLLSTLPIRTKLNSQNSFFENFKTVKEEYINAIKHKSYSYIELAKYYKKPFLLSNNPIYKVLVYEFQEIGVYKKINNPMFEWVNFEKKIKYSTYELIFVIHKSGVNEIELSIAYNKSLFKMSTIKAIMDELKNVINTIPNRFEF